MLIGWRKAKSVLFLVSMTALVLVTVIAPGAQGAACPNDALRTGPSAALPDCRAYELVSPDLNHASLGGQPAGRVKPDGRTLVYQTIDAPDVAGSASVFNLVRATRDEAKGWRGVSLSPALPAPVTSFQSVATQGVSLDLSSTFELSDQPLSGGPPRPGQNLFVGRSDGTFDLLTLVGAPILPVLDSYIGGSLAGGTPDFSHVYFQPTIAQLPADPTSGSHTYAWSRDRGTRLVGILPDGTPAPNGASLAGGGLPPVSTDGKYVVFSADDRLYVRIDDAQTIEVGASQRLVDPDPNPPAKPEGVGVTADGSTILFTSRSELTDDANTGRSGGVATDAGRDLYSYDLVTGRLTDLTADAHPDDVATGANVQINGNGSQFVRATPDGSYIYFIATGHLAEGARPGHSYLYVWHDGRIELVAQADGTDTQGRGVAFAMTPDGRRVAFASTDPLTGKDNRDPMTGQPRSEVFLATLGAGLVCVSCRADGTAPTGDSTVPVYTGLPVGRDIRVISDDGRRVFFHSTDAVVPQASSGLQGVFQYADGVVSAISRVDSPSRAVFLDASASGEDVFFTTYDDLVPNANGGDQAVFDARVGGGFPVTVTQRCTSAACRGPAPPAPPLPLAASVGFGLADDTADGSSGRPSAGKVTVSKVKSITGTAGALRVTVPGKGRLSITGSGLRTTRSSLSKAQTVTVRLVLTSRAASILRKRRSYTSRVTVAFAAAGGATSKVTLSVRFKAVSVRKGH